MSEFQQNDSNANQGTTPEMTINHLSVKTKFFVYLTHFFTTLGARMWWFGIGVFIIEVTPDSLQLTALYGFSNGASLLLFSTLVGDIIDKTARLTAARVALLLNNFGIALCCLIVFFVFSFRSDIEAKLSDQGLLKLCFALIVVLTIFSNLCNLGRTLVMERDWIVEICGRKKDMIATMSATFRFIDLVTKAIAPLVTGQLMTYVSTIYGAIFIGCWNIFAFFIEYWLLGVVYEMNPSLHSKDSSKYEKNITQQEQITSLPTNADMERSNTTTDQTQKNDSTQEQLQSDTKSETKQPSFLGKLFFSFIALYRGWRHYKEYRVALAGLALAFLYFTVLGFDNITIGYAFSQGMTESILGILVGLSACFGIIASLAYPFLRNWFGLENTGLIALTCQISCLTLCVISLWLPGGTFGPPSDVSVSIVNSTCTPINSTTPDTLLNYHGNGTILGNTTICGDTTTDKSTSGMSTSSIVLFAGVVGARFGVWCIDLTVTQLFLENVEESERGLVNGFQSSLNKLMDMLKFVMIIFISDPSMFGYPAIVSYCFICSAWVLYAVYKKRSSGKILCCDGCV